MRTVRTVFLVMLGMGAASALFIFGIDNSQRLHLKFMSHESAEHALSYFLLCAFVTGFLFAGFLSLIEMVRLNSQARKLRRMNELLEREVDALRNQPLFDEPPARKNIAATVERRLMHDGQPEESIEPEMKR